MKKLLIIVLSVIALAGVFLTSTVPGQALTFDPNNLISDPVFNSVGSMNAAQIDNFLNSFPSSCISTNSGFDARLPTGYSSSTGFTLGGFASAGQVIAAAAQAYSINPEVILATLEKEQSLVTGQNNFSGYCNNGDENKYAAAAGYGCLDGGTVYSWTAVSLYRRNGVERTSTGPTCVNTAAKAGFSEQVIRAAWLLKFGQQRSEGNINWAVITGTWNNSEDPQRCYGGPMLPGSWQRCPSDSPTPFDGSYTIDGTTVHINSGGTATLYWYTPHFAGNQNFVTIFDNWFGSTQTTDPYAWLPASDRSYMDAARTIPYSPSPTISIAPGGTDYITLEATNEGNQTWSQSNVFLGTSSPKDRRSIFADGSWANSARIVMQETSVIPGSTGTFKFDLAAPATPGSYTECFDLVAEGITWMDGLNWCYPIDVVATQNSNTENLELDPGQTINTGSYLMSSNTHTVAVLQPDGNLVLYNDGVRQWDSGTPGTGATNHLIMQTDGNLVLYNQAYAALWSSRTGGNPGSKAVLQADGNLVVYSSANQPLWSTGTNHVPSFSNSVLHAISGGPLYPQQSLQMADRSHTLLMQTDGNLVLYANGTPDWTPFTQGHPGAIMIMQADGNLVVYSSARQPLWWSGTDGNPGDRLVMQDDGNLVIYSSNNVPLWQSYTRGR